MPRPPSSRLLKKEKKKLEKQTFWFVVLALLTGAIFLFVILPQSVRLFNVFFGGPIEIKESDLIPPQIPLISVPYTATSSATMEFTGFAEAKSELVIVHNGEEVDRLEVPENGEFSFELQFNSGDHSLAAYSVDAAGNESKLSREYTITIDTSVPGIELFNIKDGQKVELRQNQRISIEGQTEPKAKVYLNDRLALPDKDGFFTTSFFLQEGENELVFTAIDAAGNKAEEVVKVEFEL